VNVGFNPADPYESVADVVSGRTAMGPPTHPRFACIDVLVGYESVDTNQSAALATWSVSARWSAIAGARLGTVTQETCHTIWRFDTKGELRSIPWAHPIHVIRLRRPRLPV
jgi:hypothetical protein